MKCIQKSRDVERRCYDTDALIFLNGPRVNSYATTAHSVQTRMLRLQKKKHRNLGGREKKMFHVLLFIHSSSAQTSSSSL